MRRLSKKALLLVLTVVTVLSLFVLAPWRMRVCTWYSRLFLKVVGARLRVHGKIPSGTYLVVSNHLSYVDIFVVSALLPVMFVTSEDLAAGNWIIRWVTRAAGCVHVDRVKRTTLLRDIKEISMLLAEGRSVVVFPEATTTSGQMLPFKPALLTCAGHGGVPVLALALRYSGVADTDDVYFYGGVGLLEHLHRLLGLRRFDVDVTVCGVFECGRDRKAFAEEVRGVIATSL